MPLRLPLYVGLVALASVMPTALAQVSSACHADDRHAASDREPPTELQQVQQHLAAGRAPQALTVADEA